LLVLKRCIFFFVSFDFIHWLWICGF
jgi:hypothetical protein